jgi:cytochrome P450
VTSPPTAPERRPEVTQPGRPPGPPGSFVRQFRPAIADPLRFLEDMAGYGAVVTLRRDRTYLVNDPEAIGRIFQDNHFNYVKGERYIRALEPLFGRGLLTSEGDLWRRQRRLIQPVFHRSNHDAYAQVIVQETEARSAHWREAARTGTALDVRDEMTELTLAILMRTVFGEASGGEIEEVGQAFLAAHHEMHIAAAFLPVQIPRWVPTPGRRRFARALATIDHFIGRMIDARQGSDNLGTDFLSRLLAARDPDSGAAMPRQQVRDEVITMLAAGHDTVTEALTWTCYFVAQHHEVETRAHDEIVRALGARAPVTADLKAMPWVTQVVEESMRLYPPIWGILRTAIAEDVLGGYVIPAGARVIASPWVVHRSPALWDAPLQFRPDRFAPDQEAGRHRFAYFPFGAGPRQCVGSQFSMLEVPIIAAMLWREFRLRLVPGQDIRPLPRVSLRADRPVWAHLSRRGDP